MECKCREPEITAITNKTTRAMAQAWSKVGQMGKADKAGWLVLADRFQCVAAGAAEAVKEEEDKRSRDQARTNILCRDNQYRETTVPRNRRVVTKLLLTGAGDTPKRRHRDVDLLVGMSADEWVPLATIAAAIRMTA